MAAVDTRVLLLGLGVALYLAARQGVQPPTDPQPVAAGRVVLYATAWCGYCAKTRRFFADNQIPYQEWDVETSATGRDDYGRLGKGVVPIIVIDQSKVIRGHDPDAIKQALGIAAE